MTFQSAGPGVVPATLRELQVVHLVRHGQSTWNMEGRIQGQTPDVPLTELGLQQAERVAAALLGCGATALYTSDQLRAVQTAEVVARVLGVHPRPTPALREQGLGSFEGRLVRDLSPEQLDAVAGLGPDGRPGGGESLRAVYARVGSLLRRLLVERACAAAVLISHGDTIRVARAWLQGHAPENVAHEVSPNGSITTVHVGRRSVTVDVVTPMPW